MKFTYDTPETETRECVAYISENGNLIVKSNYGGDVALCSSGSVHSKAEFEPDTYATHKFYRGDSITITF